MELYSLLTGVGTWSRRCKKGYFLIDSTTFIEPSDYKGLEGEVYPRYYAISNTKIVDVVGSYTIMDHDTATKFRTDGSCYIPDSIKGYLPSCKELKDHLYSMMNGDFSKAMEVSGLEGSVFDYRRFLHSVIYTHKIWTSTEAGEDEYYISLSASDYEVVEHITHKSQLCHAITFYNLSDEYLQPFIRRN